MYRTRRSRVSVDPVRDLSTLEEVQSHHSLPRPLQNKLQTIAQRAEVLTKQLQIQRFTNA